MHSSLNITLVVGLVAVGEAEVKVLDVEVEVGQDERVLDRGPNQARHLVAVHVDDGVGDLERITTTRESHTRPHREEPLRARMFRRCPTLIFLRWAPADTTFAVGAT